MQSCSLSSDNIPVLPRAPDTAYRNLMVHTKETESNVVRILSLPHERGASKVSPIMTVELSSSFAVPQLLTLPGLDLPKEERLDGRPTHGGQLLTDRSLDKP